MLSCAACAFILHPHNAAAQESALMLGSDAPAAAVTTLDGQSANLSTFLAEKKPVVLEFWATWCPLCKELEPAMAAAKKKYDGRVIFVSVGVPQNQTPEKQRDYAKAHNLGGEFVFDRDANAIAAYKANHTSYLVVVDAAGKVVYTGSGGDQSIENAIAKAFPTPGM
jgi:thiol-disulfide isomerase/thioredoxin